MLFSNSELIYRNCVLNLSVVSMEEGWERTFKMVCRQKRYSKVLLMHLINKIISNKVFIVLAPKGQNWSHCTAQRDNIVIVPAQCTGWSKNGG